MNRLILTATAFLIVIFSPVLATEQRPNFSGHWKANRGETQTGPGPYFAGRDFTAAQDQKTLTVISPSPGSQQPETKSVFDLGGLESINKVSSGGQVVSIVSKVTWRDGEMIISSTYRFRGIEIANTQGWSIDESGILKIVQTQVEAGAGRTVTGEWTYKKG